MAAEYSYFRAKGASLAAIETVNAARAEFGELRKQLSDMMGADDMMGFLSDDKKKLEVHAFVFHKEEQIPEGWEVDRQMNGDRLQAAFGLPPEGSPQHFNMEAMAGLMVRAANRHALEPVLGISPDDVPRQELPAGKYSTAFVRHRTLEDPDRPAEQRAGYLSDRVTIIGGSNSACSRPDRMDFKWLDGDWYIRVPNRAGTEEPLFVPQDGQRVEYAEMLALDERERTASRRRPAGPSF